MLPITVRVTLSRNNQRRYQFIQQDSTLHCGYRVLEVADVARQADMPITTVQYLLRQRKLAPFETHDITTILRSGASEARSKRRRGQREREEKGLPPRRYKRDPHSVAERVADTQAWIQKRLEKAHGKATRQTRPAAAPAAGGEASPTVDHGVEHSVPTEAEHRRDTEAAPR